MTREIALHCMKSASELERELCEECPIYGQTGSDHCYEDALQYVIGMLEQEPFINKPCVSSGVCEHDKQNVLDKIRAEIEIWHKEGTNWSDIRLMNIEDIIDKYKVESEG